MKTITLAGTLRGTIWMPAVECTKEFAVKFSPEDRPFTRKWTGLADALDHVTNDGDFQNCQIENMVMVIEQSEGNKSFRRVVEVYPTDITKDYFVSEEGR